MQFSLTSILFAHSVAAAAVASPAPAAAVPGAEPLVLRAVWKRQTKAVSLAPANKISLKYSGDSSSSKGLTSGSLLGSGGSSSIAASKGVTSASIDGNMKLPSVVLESIATIKGVSCATKGSVIIPFTDATDYASAKKQWPAKDFVFVTTSDGSCASDGQRGFYSVSALAFDDKKTTVTATAASAAIKDVMNDAQVQWATTPGAKAKRSLDLDLSIDLSGKKLVDQGPFSVTADVAKYTGDISISGSLSFNFLKLKLSSMSVDLDYNSALALNLTTAVKASKDTTQSLKFEPLDATVSAFSIPGILDVGPLLSFGLGVELSASGTVTVKTGILTTFTDSKVHLDFIDAKSSTATGWKPVTTMDNTFSVDASLQVNPYAELTVGMGVKAFAGLVDLTASVDTKPTLVNSFNAHAEVTSTYKSDTGSITFSAPKNVDKECKNGAWFASSLQFGVTASIGTLSTDLFSTTIPVFESQCFSFNLIKRDDLTTSPALPRRAVTGRRIAAY
ncbi:hypothetical protein MCOR25_001261 [Pyricularia grisea]|uniref:Uncharacterized protein n=1 Tax=Pyricularia grisea TaxID=148305 RepID=A0A6P8BG26_PYRGI|nr:uncharacterized protein PgNI_00733 [Pyricularia grisea]KAI6381329.1 hypothetical protein MCOR25_001261 [Pyricularia grisea]TLD15816.1 hypothetical protein PgNI_00733 [Pyricularia grisea]